MKRRRGAVLTQLMLVLSVSGLLVMVAANRQLQRVKEARSAYLDSAAQELAEGGIEASMAAINRRHEPAAAPLGEAIQLTDAVGTLNVVAERIDNTFRVESCARVEMPHARASRPEVRRCIEAEVTRGRSPTVLSWREYTPRP